MTKLKIGIISFEHMHAHAYSTAFDRVHGAELVAISDSDPTRLETIKASFPSVAEFYNDYKDMLEKSSVDAVIICSANNDHKPIALECAKHGKHILCEKPLAITVEDSQEIIDAAKDNKITLMTAFPVRFSPSVWKAKELIKNNDLGKVLGASTSNHGSLPGGWFLEKEKSGGGAVIDHTVHVVDALRWVFDDEVESVYAEYDKLLNDNIKVEDVGQLILKFKKGTIVSLDTSWSRPKSYSIWGDVKISIKGEKANITLNCFPQQINQYDDVQMKHSGFNMGEDLDQLMVQEFIDAVHENREPLVTGLDGLKAVEVALAAYKSKEIGAPVTL